MLPLGIRTLPQIEAERDLVRRVRDAGVLLKFLLAHFEPDATDDHGRRDFDLATRVKRNDKLFAEGMPDLLHAIQASEAAARGEPLLDEAKKRAAATLLHAARSVLPRLPDDLCREIHGAPPEAQPQRGQPPGLGDQTEVLTRAALFRDLLKFARLAMFVVIAGAIAFGAVKLPGLLAQTPADVQARQQREQAKREEAERKEAANAVRTGLGLLVERARQAHSAAEQLVREIEAYERDTEPLLLNDKGRTLAADTSGVETLAVLLEKPRPTRDEATALRHRVEEDLVRPLAEAYKANPPGVADPSRGTHIDEALGQATTGLSAYRALSAAFAALTATDPNGQGQTTTGNSATDGLFAPSPASAPTLEEAVNAVRRRHTRAGQQTVLESAAKEREAAATRLAEAEAAKTRAAAEAETQRKLAEVTAKQREAELVKAKAEADRLRARANDPKVIGVYSQFLSAGRVYFKRGRHGFLRYELSVPLSYDDLKDIGATSDWRVFAHLAAKKAYSSPESPRQWYAFHENDRPGVWGYPSTPAEVEKFKKAMALFNDLAPYWIEQGKLLK
jgi:hypothetical protein